MDDMQKEIDELKERLNKLEEYNKQVPKSGISLSEFCQLMIDDLNVITERIEKLDGKVPAEELFTENFMRQHTQVSSFEEFLIQGGFGTDTESFNAIPTDELDEYVKKHSDFACWQDMFKSSTANYVYRQLKDGLKVLNISLEETQEEE